MLSNNTLDERAPIQQKRYSMYDDHDVYSNMWRAALYLVSKRPDKYILDNYMGNYSLIAVGPMSSTKLVCMFYTNEGEAYEFKGLAS